MRYTKEMQSKEHGAFYVEYSPYPGGAPIKRETVCFSMSARIFYNDRKNDEEVILMRVTAKPPALINLNSHSLISNRIIASSVSNMNADNALANSVFPLRSRTEKSTIQ